MPVERKALACGLSPEVKPASMKQEWNRGFGAFLRNPDFRRFSGTVNSHKLEDIEWVRDDGSVITFDPQLIEEWKFMGLTNVCFLEMFLTRVVEGEEKELLHELNTWETLERK